MKNILFVSRSTTFHFESGGMESHLKLVAEGLAAKGHNVVVLTSALFKDGKVLEHTVRETHNKVNYIFLGNTDSGLNPLTSWDKFLAKIKILSDPYSDRRGNKNFYYEVYENFKTLHEEFRFDVILSQSTAAYGLYTFANKELPLIAILHGSIMGELKTRWQTAKSFKNYIRYFILDWPKMMIEFNFLQGVFLNACKKIIVVSDSLREEMLKEIASMPNVGDVNLYDSKVVVVKNGVDSELFKPSIDKYEDFTCLYVGRIAEEKGIGVILEAAEFLRSKNSAQNQTANTKIKFKIIGSGPDLEKFKLYAKQKNLDESYVLFEGQISNEKLPEIYSKSHIFVFPTQREEGHPVTFSESMCSGLPYVASPKGGLKELVKDGENGYFVSNATELVAKIEELYNKPEILNKLAANSRQAGLELYSKDVMINKYQNLLEH